MISDGPVQTVIKQVVVILIVCREDRLFLCLRSGCDAVPLKPRVIRVAGTAEMGAVCVADNSGRLDLSRLGFGHIEAWSVAGRYVVR